ncbi:MAG TPA: LysR family transcriptional regulator [Burkholderiales bacterium]|jgi:DNA-binding transcriptional LysR family regulator|nr:LysR family transcriptional regulator [Burkholderiales bacterium]
MDWNDVDAFCCVIEYGGFTAAAKALGRPKSSVSASVARLEGELGARLLQRTTRRVRPTEAGESLFQDAAPMFQRLREVRANAAARGNAVAGTLRIAAPYEFGAHHLGAVACAMLARYRDLRIDIDVEYGRVDPLDRSYDIVFSYYDQDLPDSGRVARRVFSLKRGLFAAPRLLERHRQVRAPEDLADLPAIAAPADAEWSFTDAKGSSHSVPIRPRMRSPNADVRRRATLEGLGVSRIVYTFCQEAVKEGRLQELLPDYECAPLRIYALLPGRRLVPPKARIFLETLGAGG